ncbi:MAG: HEAT repeat domain-containing protein [Chloroflexota bacterium]|nr:HEAT repeat domain-containing protein [Chloroflexota bacterium]
MILILTSLWVFSTSQASRNGRTTQDVNSIAPKSENRALPDLNSPDANNQWMEYYARDLYYSEHLGAANGASAPFGSPEAMQTMLRALQQGQPAERRASAMNAFIQAPPSVVPSLLDALTDSDPGVRRGAAEILGARRAPEAEDSLFFATYDADPGVRAASARALGDLGAMYALPRLEWLEVTETDSDVRLAARLAEKRVYAIVAAILGIQPGDLRVVAVAPSNERVYAATKAELYSPNGLDWGRVGTLPDIPTALTATGNDGRVLYLGTASSGVFRSFDGGVTWQAINRNLPAANPFAVTAVTVNPENDRQIYIALAANSGTIPLMPFGLFQSADAGENWSPLIQWNVDEITTRLVIDPSEPARLLGLTNAGTWQYPLAKALGHEP